MARSTGPKSSGRSKTCSRDASAANGMSAADKRPLSRGQAHGRRIRFRPIADWAAFHTNSFGLRRKSGFQARRQPVKEDPQLERHGLAFRVEDVDRQRILLEILEYENERARPPRRLHLVG